MGAYKFYYIFVLLFLSNQVLCGMGTGHIGMTMSKEYNSFIEELNKSQPDASYLSELYNQIENDQEKVDTLREATKKNIEIKGQQEAQEKIKKQLLSKKLVYYGVIVSGLSNICNII